MIQNIRHIALFILFVCSCLAVQAQGTLDKLKFEEAEQKYLNKDYSGAITLLEELEQKGLKNPRTLHLKIMAVSKHHAPGYDIVVQFKKDVDYYLKNYDIEGLEDKYKEVYEVSKTLSAPKYDEGILAEKNAQTYYNAKDYKNAMQWFLKADSYGNPSDKIGFYTGLMYEKGWGVEQNYTEAAKWYTKSAEQGNVNAQALLGYFFNVGQGVEKDYKKAVAWYTKAAEKGNAGAQYNLGVIYKNGEGVEQDYKKAAEWYTKAANQNNIKAYYNLGVLYEKGQGVEQNYKKAFEWYTKAAEKGDIVAQWTLASKYATGHNVEQDYKKAFEWCSKAAEQGKHEAQYNLGKMYEDGVGTEKDLNKAIEWYTKAANQGYSYAQYHLGVIYKNGEGVEKDYKKAFEWYTKASEQGNVEAQTGLGLLYANGEGVEKDLDKAIEWYTKAAEKDNVYAQTNLGRIYAFEEGFDTNIQKGIEWMKKAVEGGYKSTFYLALAYEKIGNYTEAYKYFQQSNETGKLGYYFYDGKTTIQDYSKAVEYWEMAGKKAPIYNLCLAVAYCSGKGIPKDDAKALLLIKGVIEKYKETNILKNYKETREYNKKHFPKYSKDEDAFFEWLAKEHNIVFEK